MSWGVRRKGSKVVVNVYDLSPEQNACLHPWGFGAYHSGVEINGTEYTYGGQGGIFDMEPRNAGPGAVFRESIEMGTFEGTTQDLNSILTDLKIDFDGSKYNLLTKNCNHFADSFLRRLLNKPLPGYINRLALLGSAFSCLLPPSVTGAAPVDSSGGNSVNNRGYEPLVPSRSVSMETETRTPSHQSYITSSGVRLGSLSSDVSDTDNSQNRRERMRAAALERFSMTSSNGERKKE
mmetsp:Transcript_35580/g.36275  ORF Transcript_35580/g.36275 Transcript_35580/m.36275 type:complete len:236 (-) Transcript_35580:22-729(-)